MEQGKIRDLRNSGWFRTDDVFIDKYAKFIGVYGIAVYICLCRHSDKNGNCWPGINSIAERLGCGRDSIIRAIKELAAWNIIRVEKNGNGKNNDYYLIDKSEWKEIDQNSIKSVKDSKYGVESPQATGRVAVGDFLYKEDTMKEEEDFSSEKQEETVEYPELGFPTPEDWEVEDLGMDEYGNTNRYFRKNGVRIKQREINELRKAFVALKKTRASVSKAFETREKTHTLFSKNAIKQLKEAQGIDSLDGGSNYGEAQEFKGKFQDYLIKQKRFQSVDLDDIKLISEFITFLGIVKKNSSFHWNNLTSFRYLNNNFNKILKSLSTQTETKNEPITNASMAHMIPIKELLKAEKEREDKKNK